jgi:hypothetical protein
MTLRLPVASTLMNSRAARRSRVTSRVSSELAAALALGVLFACSTCRAEDAPVCRSGAARAGAPEGDEPITADTPGSDGTRLFPRGKSVRIDVVTRAKGDDKVQWRITDTWSRAQASGSFAVAGGPRVTSLTCTMPQAGYFAFSAS